MGSLWQCYRDDPDLNNAGVIIDFDGNDAFDSFKFKEIFEYILEYIFEYI